MKSLVLVLGFVVLLVASTVAIDPVCLQAFAQDGQNGIKCLAAIFSWSYNVDTGRCEQFIYGGCGGNENRFDSQAQCEAACL